MDREPEHAAQRLLDRGAADLAVPLSPVRVAGIEEGAGVEDREIDRRPRFQVLHVEVAAEGSRRPRALDAGNGHAGLSDDRVRSHCQDPHERGQWHLDVFGEEGDLAPVRPPGPDEVAGSRRDVQRRVVRAKAGVALGEDAAPGRGVVDAPRHPGLDGEDLDLEHVSGLGALDEHRTGDDVAAPTLAGPSLPRGPEVQDVLVDLLGRHSERGKPGDRLLILHRPAVGEGVHPDGLPGPDPEHGFLVDREPAPAHVLR